MRVIGASDEVLAYVQSCEVPVTDRNSPEGKVVLQGIPLLIEDIQSVWQELHPINRRLAELSRSRSLIIVPLKAKDHILGTLTVDRTAPTAPVLSSPINGFFSGVNTPTLVWNKSTDAGVVSDVSCEIFLSAICPTP